MTEEDYFDGLESRLDELYGIADRARSKGEDPVPEVEIPVAEDLAERVENLVGVEGVADRIRELESEEDSREDVSLRLAEEFADGRFPPEEDDEKAEAAIRTAVALLTEGVVAAPIEGIDGVDLLENDDGTEYLRVEYAGPIRSAGGTAQALSVLIADYVGSSLGVDAYRPRGDEVERYIEEVNLYADETGLQYTPKDDETRLIIENCPIRLDGEPTTEREVSGYRDLERIDTNRGRGGMCLVAAEGIALKAPKIKKYVDALGMDGWDWIEELMHTPSDNGGDEGDDDEGDDEGIEPSYKYLEDLTAGRPILSHPSRPGGFRLRYARARNTGLAASGVSPATMVLFDDFLAAGTQLKTERPGKAQGVAPVDGLEGPTVVLSNGEVRRIDDADEARRVRNGVERIVDVGEMGVPYGEFLENNHPLAPGSYTYEWWIQEVEASDADVEDLRRAFDLRDPPAKGALRLARKYNVPLHPRYTYLWHDVDADVYTALADAAERSDGELVVEGEEAVAALERLLVPHTQEGEGDDTEARVTGDHAHALSECLDTSVGAEDSVEAAGEAAGVTVRERAPTRMGARMGRPEKSEERELNPAVHCLFPIGDAGGSQRDIDEATSHSESMRDTVGEIEVRAGGRRCPSCGEETYKPVCDCGERTEPVHRCPSCEIEVDAAVDDEPCPRCGGATTTVRAFEIRVDEEYERALDSVGERPSYDILKCVKGLTSRSKTPEPLEKGVLRAKHDVSTFKDGTVRYDMTDLPLTSFRPDEVGVSVERLRELGYERDTDGEPLEDPEQVVGLKPQDVVLSRDSAEHLKRVADFIDDLLVRYYDEEPYHGLDEPDDLVGELVMGLAPHTSAGVLGRVVGFTDASVGYAHPFFHAAKRRNCFAPDTKIPYTDERGERRHETVERLVEARISEAEEGDIRADDFGGVVADTEGIEVPSLDGDGKFVTKPVEAVSRHPAPEHLVEMKTRSGREIVVTPDHEIQVYDGGNVTPKRASEVSEGDSLMTPRQYVEGDEERQTRTLDLLDEFVSSDSVDNERLMVHGIGKERLYGIFEDELADGGPFNVLADTASHLGVTKKTVSNYVYRDSVPISVLIDVLGARRKAVDVVPKDVSLGIKRDNATVDRHVEVDEDVATLFGYYAAEGFSRLSETSKGVVHQTTFCGTEDGMRELYVEVLRDRFGVEPYRENHAKVTVSGCLFRLVFDEVLDAGSGAKEKRVPQRIFDSPRDVVAAYLRGYFSGDGSVEKGRLVVEATTVSRELKRDLTALLTRLGIKARSKEYEPVPLNQQFPDYYADDEVSISATRYVLTVSSEDAVRFADEVGFHLPRKSAALTDAVETVDVRKRRVFDGGGPRDAFIDTVESVGYTRSEGDYVYCLTVEDTHSLVVNDLASKQCDGDEDCVTLMSDALLNFSREYLPDQRGGRMDAPLVMTSRIDPTEIDDEAHNIDKTGRYPLSFYEAAREHAHPKEAEIPIAEDDLGTQDAFEGFDHTVETSSFDSGPANSAYKILPSMDEKTTAQLEIGRKTRAVDESDVAERVVESHFLPDLIGNLRAFTQQEFRCLDCNEKYRRPPLSGGCDCGGEITLTVHKGSVKKYLDVSLEVGEEYGVSDYTMQRLEQLRRQIDSLFEDDKSRQSGIADFM